VSGELPIRFRQTPKLVAVPLAKLANSVQPEEVIDGAGEPER
jgi:hypothetical protein